MLASVLALAALGVGRLGAAINAERLYEGEIVPRDFEAVFAPMNTLRLPHWGSSSNGIQLQDVKDEDVEVKAGDVIAQFRFGHDRAREHLDQHHAQLVSQRDEELQGFRKGIKDLEHELSRLTIEREKLRLDIMLSMSLARVKQKLIEFDYQLKALEVDAAELRIKAAKTELAWSESVHAARIRAWDANFTVFEETKARYTVKAPVAGRIFYPTLESSNRKVRKGDDMNSGTHFLSIVRTDRAQVRFYLPESDWDRVHAGDTVTVAPDSPSPYRAKVIQKDYFSQYVGDARRNFRLPAAWEKCFVVEAEVDGAFSKIAKKEVTVRLAR